MHNTTKTICSISAGLFVLSTLAACNKAPEKKERPPAPVTVIEVKPTDVPLTKEMIGETAGYRDVEVRSRVNGILLKRTYVEGQNVKAGQILFEIDPEPYKAILDQAKGVLSQAASNLDKARADRDRITPLFKENAVSRKDFDDANTAYNAAIASHNAAQASVRQAELNLEYTKVTAPISGTTSKLAQSEGSLISATGESGKLTTISQYNPLYVNFSYSEQDKQELESSQSSGNIVLNHPSGFSATIKLADGSTYSEVGQVNFSDNRVDPTTGTIRARAIFKNEKGQLLPGQFVRITLDIGTWKNAISIPSRAVVQSQADFVVMTVDKDNKVVPKPITFRPSKDGQVVVKTGLRFGDKVITEGQMKAPPGSTVKPIIASAPAASK
nr:efflux RND transporter periplasmic adaptor subunit [uncultured Deefgea sp.]